jgi:hypothetical protein
MGGKVTDHPPFFPALTFLELPARLTEIFSPGFAHPHICIGFERCKTMWSLNILASLTCAETCSVEKRTAARVNLLTIVDNWKMKIKIYENSIRKISTPVMSKLRSLF